MVAAGATVSTGTETRVDPTSENSYAHFQTSLAVKPDSGTYQVMAATLSSSSDSYVLNKVYNSTDSGATWTARSTPVSDRAGESFVAWGIRGSGCTGTYGCAYWVHNKASSVTYLNLSTDGGATWTNLGSVGWIDKPEMVVDNRSGSNGNVYISGKGASSNNFFKLAIWDGTNFTLYTGDTVVSEPGRPAVLDDGKVFIPINGSFSNLHSCGGYDCQDRTHKYFLVDPSGSVSGYTGSPSTAFSEEFINDADWYSDGTPNLKHLGGYFSQVVHGHTTSGTEVLHWLTAARHDSSSAPGLEIRKVTNGGGTWYNNTAWGNATPVRLPYGDSNRVAEGEGSLMIVDDDSTHKGYLGVAFLEVMDNITDKSSCQEQQRFNHYKFDVYATKSTDNGANWDTPVKLNSAQSYPDMDDCDQDFRPPGWDTFWSAVDPTTGGTGARFNAAWADFRPLHGDTTGLGKLYVRKFW